MASSDYRISSTIYFLVECGCQAWGSRRLSLQTGQVCRGSKGGRKYGVVFKKQPAGLHAWGTESRGDRPEAPGLGVFHALSCINLFTPHRDPGEHLRWYGILQEMGQRVTVEAGALGQLRLRAGS